MHPKKCLPVILAVLLVAGGCSKSPEEVKAEKAKVEAETTGKLTVKSSRPNATVEAKRAGDAAAVKGSDEGAAEHLLSALPPGKYTVTAHAPGWPDASAEANVEAGRTAEVTVNFKSGSLRLDSVPTGAAVKAAGATLGKTPLLIAQLPPGENKLSLEYPSWPVLAFTTTITENVETTETVRLPHGKLTVESTPAGATVLQGKRTLGSTPLNLERVPAGTMKLTLTAKDFPPLEVAVKVEDKGEAMISPELGSGFPELDPPALLRSVWVPDNPNRIAPQFDTSGPYQPQNGVVKNLNRKQLYQNWLNKSYRISGTVKAYNTATGRVEFADQKAEPSAYRVVATLSPEARGNKDLAALVAKGATFNLYGRLTAVEEGRWPTKMITLELSAAEPLR